MATAARTTGTILDITGKPVDVEAQTPTLAFVDITPEIALLWLGRNAINRDVDPGVVNRYAADIAAGRWTLTGAPLQFSVTGRLQDGQHRLRAVVKADQTVRMSVTTGLPDEAQGYMDIGKKRTAADMLSLGGIGLAADMAATARVLLRWDTGTLTSGLGQIVTDRQVADYAMANPEIQESVRRAATYTRAGLQLPRSIVAAAYHRILSAGNDAELVQDFFDNLATGVYGKDDTRRALNNRITSARRNRERIPQIGYLSMLLRSWNDYVRGISRQKISPTNREGQYELPTIEVL